MLKPDVQQFMLELRGNGPLSARTLAAFSVDPVKRIVQNVDDVKIKATQFGIAKVVALFTLDGQEVVDVPLDNQLSLAKGDNVVLPVGEINMDFGFCLFCVLQIHAPRIEDTIKSLQALEAELREELQA